MSSIEIIPIGRTLGAEVRGLDLREAMTPDDRAALTRAWDAHLVLLIRDQDIDDRQLIAFSRDFGELEPPAVNPHGRHFLPEYPEINVISNLKDEGGQALGTLGDGEAVWHADMTYREAPPEAAILHAREIPDGEGDTCFANTIAACAALSADLRARAEGRMAIHDESRNSAGQLRKGYEAVSDPRETPGARHPLIRRDDGREALFLGRRPFSHVPGLEEAQSEALLDELWAHATAARFTWCHRWRVGDVLMWRNLWVLHRRDAFDPASRRRLHRTQIKGRDEGKAGNP